MKGKILLVVGLGVGYVLGARAGRERYEDIKRMTNRFWNDPRVQTQVSNAEDFVKDKAPDVAAFVSDGAKKVVTGARKTSGKPATRSTSTPGSSTSKK
jgi:hypothetical protein